MLKTVLFDLDGTLLPMDQDEFVNGYFGFLVEKMAPHGYDGKQLVKTVWGGTAAMVENDGSRTNEQVFWSYFAGVYGEEAARRDLPLFEEFYAVDFQKAKCFCGFHPAAADCVRYVRSKGGRTVLATNPLFPSYATERRMRWAGLDPEDFELYTSYESIGCCKPNLAYYREILRRLRAEPADCLMVGNDTGEDMIAETLGMKTFLLTDCLINKTGADLNRWPHGDFAALRAFLETELEHKPD